jgi:hypothetical protein
MNKETNTLLPLLTLTRPEYELFLTGVLLEMTGRNGQISTPRRKADHDLP